MQRVLRSHCGGAYGGAAARALLVSGLSALGLGAKEWRELPRNAPEKTALAWWLRERTPATLKWVSEELGLGLHASDAGGQPEAAPGGEKTGATEATAAANGEKSGVKEAECHYYRNAPFTQPIQSFGG